MLVRWKPVKIVYYSVLIFNWWSIVYWLNYIFYAVYNNFFYNIGWRISAADSYNKEKIVYLFYPPPKDCGKKTFYTIQCDRWYLISDNALRTQSNGHRTQPASSYKVPMKKSIWNICGFVQGQWYVNV